MRRQFFQLGQFGHFRVRAGQILADDQPGWATRVLRHEPADDFADGVGSIRDAKEDFPRAAIGLCEPALKRGSGGGVASFERLQDGNRRGKAAGERFCMQWESLRGEPLPEQEKTTQGGEGGQSWDCIMHRPRKPKFRQINQRLLPAKGINPSRVSLVFSAG